MNKYITSELECLEERQLLAGVHGVDDFKKNIITAAAFVALGLVGEVTEATPDRWFGLERNNNNNGGKSGGKGGKGDKK